MPIIASAGLAHSDTRSIIDIVKRALNNVLANWPLLLISVAEGMVLGMILVVGLLVTIVPIIVVGAMAAESLDASTFPEDDPLAALTWLVIEHPFMVLFAILAVTVIVVILVALHAFVRAGMIGVYVDAEVAAGARIDRGAFKVFTPETWFGYGRKAWWALFLIYQVTWGLYGLVLLIPLIILVAGIVLTIDTDAVVFVGIGGGALLVLVAMVLGIIVNIWTQLSLTEAVRGNLPAMKAIRSGTAIFRARLGEIAIVVVILFGIIVAAMMLIMVLYMMLGAISVIPLMSIATIPFQIVLSVAQSALSTFLSCWFIAAFAAICVRHFGAGPGAASPAVVAR